MKLASVFLAILLVFTSNSLAKGYPKDAEKFEDVKRFIKDANIKTVCEKKTPRTVGTIIYRNDKTEWLVRAYTKDGEELEIWFNKKLTYWGAFYPDKIFYNIPAKGWIDKDTLSPDEAYELDARLIFTVEEKLYFKKCAEEAEKKRKNEK